jgi:predicted RNA-binding protein associated with RNAse of E/G family
MYDLCLDLWVDRGGDYVVLDRDEFDEAVDRRWIDRETARRARQELETLVAGITDGDWPPEIVRTHDLDRVRQLAASR